MKLIQVCVYVAVVASLSREMAARSFAYHAHGKADSDKNPAVIRGLCAMTNIKSALLAQALPPPPDDKSSYQLMSRHV